MSLVRSADALINSGGQVVRFSLGASRLPPVTATARLAEAFRSAALAAFQVVTGHRESFLLSGHKPDGKPGQGHQHGFYLPAPDDKGNLVALYLSSPAGRFSREEMEALKLIRVVQWDCPSTRVNVELSDGDDDSLSQVAAKWATVTPYVPPRRFYGTHGKHHLVPEIQIVQELRAFVPGSYEVDEIRPVRGWVVAVRLPDRSITPLRLQKRQGFCVRFRSSSPLCGPVVVGHSTHFGLGQFRPV